MSNISLVDNKVPASGKLYLLLFVTGICTSLPLNSFIIWTDLKYTGGTLIKLNTVKIAAATHVFSMCLLMGTMTFMNGLSRGMRVVAGLALILFACFVIVEVPRPVNPVMSGDRYAMMTALIVSMVTVLHEFTYFEVTAYLEGCYIHALLLGEAVPPLLLAFYRLLYINLVVTNETLIEAILFMVIICTVILHTFIHPFVINNPFILYNAVQAERKVVITLEPTEDVQDVAASNAENTVEPENTKFGVLSLQSPPPITPTVDNETSDNMSILKDTPKDKGVAFSFSNPLYCPNAAAPKISYKVEDVIDDKSLRRWNNFYCFKHRCQLMTKVIKAFYGFIVCEILTQLPSVFLFPGIAMDLFPCLTDSGLAASIVIVYYMCDFIGRACALWPCVWARGELLLCVTIRLGLPLIIMLTLTPVLNTLLPFGVYPILFSMLLGVTHGIFSTIPIIQKKRVPTEHLEMVAQVMLIAHYLGSSSGALFALQLRPILRSSLAPNCQVAHANSTMWMNSRP